ncbi:hypothetical protein NOR51B_593 [Luminiphilus syltensis NOR5-1B]|uniref:Uncharacterized protein n=2 Tax=Luminiphilus TaxID=1341118 RepID=B8KTC1_9GAMM|nr:hypothetical protein NOR51B_593 [Luminiphilus syltensis NOR5-1B]
MEEILDQIETDPMNPFDGTILEDLNLPFERLLPDTDEPLTPLELKMLYKIIDTEFYLRCLLVASGYPGGGQTSSEHLPGVAAEAIFKVAKRRAKQGKGTSESNRARGIQLPIQSLAAVHLAWRHLSQQDNKRPGSKKTLQLAKKVLKNSGVNHAEVQKLTRYRVELLIAEMKAGEDWYFEERSLQTICTEFGLRPLNSMLE